MMYTFIVNPKARSGLGEQTWQEISSILEERKIAYQVFFTERRNHATEIVRQLTESGEELTLIILGGDGAVNEVINGITDFSKVTLGYLPLGSGNDFARGMGLSTDYREGLEKILNPSEIRPINIGIATFPENRQRKFAVSSGLGYDAGICHQVLVSKWKVWLNRLGLGKLSYAVVGIQRLFRLHPGAMTLLLDGKTKIQYPHTYFIAAFNTKYEGGGVKFCPHADPTDDLLDVIVVEGISKAKVLFLLPLAFFGAHVHFKGIHIYRCRQADVESELALPVHTDGEPVFLKKHISFSLESQKLRLIMS